VAVRFVDIRGGCLFCWYWWNCWPSLHRGGCLFCWYWWWNWFSPVFKLYFHKIYNYILQIQLRLLLFVLIFHFFN
jgi:hypothetical protein